MSVYNSGIDSNALKGAILSKKYTYEEVSKKINISVAALYRKINNKTQFTLKEIKDLKILLCLNEEQMHNIFFK